MKVGILSDTHDRLPTFRRALELFRRFDVEAVFHAGDLVAPFAAKLLTAEDGPLPPSLCSPGSERVHVIYGNNDGEREGLKKVLPQIADGPLRVTLPPPPETTPPRERDAGKPTVVAMAHFFEWFAPADLAGADVVISGHDHTPAIQTREVGGRNVLLINPGECCGWVTGRCTVALLEIDGQGPRAELIDVQG
jgi:predicted phosphodiesterase